MVQSLRAILPGLILLWRRWSIAQQTVWPDRIVMVTPAFDQHLLLRERIEYLRVQDFIPKLSIETLVVAVLARVARLGVDRLHAGPAQSFRHSIGGELRAII